MSFSSELHYVDNINGLLESYANMSLPCMKDIDYKYEDFWYGTKNSIINFCKGLDHKNKVITDFIKNIEFWTCTLNDLKKTSQYSTIIDKISEYMSIYSLFIVKFEETQNDYHSSILHSNIKRWCKIKGEHMLNYPNILLFEAYYRTKKNYIAKTKNILDGLDGLDGLKNIIEEFRNISEIIVENNFDLLIMLSIKTEQTKLLESIKIILGQHLFHKKIKLLFPIYKIDPLMSCLKIIKKINSNISLKSHIP